MAVGIVLPLITRRKLPPVHLANGTLAISFSSLVPLWEKEQLTKNSQTTALPIQFQGCTFEDWQLTCTCPPLAYKKYASKSSVKFRCTTYYAVSLTFIANVSQFVVYNLELFFMKTLGANNLLQKI